MKQVMILAIFFLAIISVSAHLEAGEDVIINNYLIDFGYEPAELVADEPATLAFNLVSPSTQETLPFDHLWVRISSPEQIIFAGPIKQQAQHVNLAFTFPSQGQYEIVAKFKNNEETITETNFYVEVIEEKDISLLSPLLLVTIVGLLFALTRKRR
jgi:hypothetical protein